MKTSELTGAALDWAVANCEGLLAFGWKNDTGILRITLSTGECIRYIPSDDWSQGGPIIEREKIDLSLQFYGWVAHHGKYRGGEMNQPYYTQKADTPLIAAMRCYVASKMGNEVEIPEGLA